jgi:hypothetical protein
VFIVPAAVTVTVTPSATLILPMPVVAKVTVEFAEKSASLREVQAVPPVGLGAADQLVPVHVPAVPSVRQNWTAAWDWVAKIASAEHVASVGSHFLRVDAMDLILYLGPIERATDAVSRSSLFEGN